MKNLITAEIYMEIHKACIEVSLYITSILESALQYNGIKALINALQTKHYKLSYLL